MELKWIYSTIVQQQQKTIQTIKEIIIYNYFYTSFPAKEEVPSSLAGAHE